MSDTDSFIEEVSEEVRRDRLFLLFRRYGWIPAVLVVVLVGAAAYNEWSKAQTIAAAQDRGDAIFAAMQVTDADARKTALENLKIDGNAQAIVGLLTASAAVEADDPAATVAALKTVADDATLPALYRDLARMKLVLATAGETPPAQRIEDLQPLTTAGGPFRVLAEEQIALAEVEMGEVFAALDRLRALQNDTETTAGLRRRVTQLIVALGGEAEAS